VNVEAFLHLLVKIKNVGAKVAFDFRLIFIYAFYQCSNHYGMKWPIMCC